MKMALELIPVEPRTIILAMNYTPHLLLLFVFQLTRNGILDLVTLCKIYVNELSQGVQE